MALIDFNLSALPPSPHEAQYESIRSSTQTAILVRHERQLLHLWREAFRRRFGLPLPADTVHACWVETLIRAALLTSPHLTEPAPDASAVAGRAAQALVGSPSRVPPTLELRTLVHVERHWLRGASLKRVRAAAEELVQVRSGPVGVGPDGKLMAQVRS